MSIMQKKKVLIVDDDNLICWGLEKEISGAGLATRVVENAADALSELRRQPYDTVFLDIRLPDSNGLDLLSEIGKISPDAKVIVMSGNATETNRERAFTCGAVKFLEKPFELSEVHAILRDALAGKLRKRQHPRNACRIPLRITIVKPTPEEARYNLTVMSGVMADVGLGGFRLRTKYPLAVGQNIRANVDVVGDNPSAKLFPPQAAAEVVWVAPAHDSVTAGLKFLS